MKTHQKLEMAGLLALSLAGIGVLAAQKAAPPRPAQKTIEGLVRDLSCPIQNKQSTATRFNLECARILRNKVRGS